MTDLNSFGFTPDLSAYLQDIDGLNAIPARIINQQRRNYVIISEGGELSVTLPSGLTKRLVSEGGSGALPVVGDWVAVLKGPKGEDHRIAAVLPRRNKLSRKVAGRESREQVIAANLDRIYIITSVGREFNPRRLERYLAIAHETGAEIVIILNKIDRAEGSVEPYLRRIRTVASEVKTLAVSAKTGAGLAALRRGLKPGETLMFIGSSGVGKSTLINTLLGYERQQVLEVRSHDAHGRHATSSRELILLPGGAMIIDNPGLREIQLWVEDDGRGLALTFGDIKELAGACRFRDCRHLEEPGCAVKRAVENGSLEQQRLASYLKLRGEQESTQFKRDRRAQKAQGRMFASYRKQMEERRRRGEKG